MSVELGENTEVQTVQVAWTNELIFDLITAVEEREIIWNVKSSQYKNRDGRERAWSAIAKKINVTKQAANDKWRLLRQQFRNALKKMNQSKSGNAAESKKPPNDYVNAMMFLQPVMSMQSECRESNKEAPPSPANSIVELISDETMNSKIYEIWASDIDVSSNTSSSRPALSSLKRSRKSKADVCYRTAVAKAMKIVEEKDESPEQIWARYIVSVMSNHSNKNAVRQFKFRVNRLAEQLEMGELDNSTLPAMPMQSPLR